MGDGANTELHRNLLGNYSRNFPFKTVGDSLSRWLHNSITSIGLENPSYTNYLSQMKNEAIQKAKEQRNIIIYIVLLCSFASVAIFKVLSGRL